MVIRGITLQRNVYLFLWLVTMYVKQQKTYRRGHDYKHSDLININETTHMIEIQRKLRTCTFQLTTNLYFLIYKSLINIFPVFPEKLLMKEKFEDTKVIITSLKQKKENDE